MAKVKIGDKIVKIGDDDYKPSVEEIEEVANQLGITGEKEEKFVSPQISSMGTRKDDPFQDPKVAKQVAQGAIGVPTGFTGGFIQDLTEAAIKKTTGKDIKLPRGSIEGQIIGASMPGSIPFRGGVAAGKATKALIGAETAKAVQGLKLGGLPSVREAVAAGIVGGFAFPTQEASIEDRIKNSLAGGFGGGVIGSVIKTGVAINQSFKAFNMMKDINKQLRQVAGSKEGKEIIRLESVKGKAKKVGDEAIQLATNEAKYLNARAAQEFKKYQNSTARDIRPEILDKVIKQPGRRYGEMLDVMIDNADAVAKASPGGQRNGITFQDIDEIADETINELVEMGLDLPNVKSQISSIAKSIGGGKDVTIFDQFGRPNKARNTDFVDLKKLIKAKQKLFASQTSGAKEGSKKFTPEDLAISIYQKNLGERLNKVLNGQKGLNDFGAKGLDISKLNNQYRQAVRLQKFVFKHFRPGTGQYDTKAANTFLKNLGIKPNSLTPEDFMAMSNIEDGLELIEEGIGPMTRGVRQAGKQVQKTKAITDEKIAFAEQRLSERLEAVNNRLSKLSSRNRALVNQLNYEAAELESALGAAKLIKQAGSAAGFGIVQGAAAFALYHTIFKEK